MRLPRLTLTSRNDGHRYVSMALVNSANELISTVFHLGIGTRVIAFAVIGYSELFVELWQVESKPGQPYWWCEETGEVTEVGTERQSSATPKQPNLNREINA